MLGYVVLCSVMEHWVEVNLPANRKLQDGILLDVLKPHIEKLQAKHVLVTWHFFREPEIRFRVRLRNKKAKDGEIKAIAKLARFLQREGLISDWRFGSHGERGSRYRGEEDRYGRNGWKVAQDYFNQGATIALRLLELKRENRLENPLWAKGLGNPWEGEKKNPWRQHEKNPLAYHWSRYVHLFTNQLGFEINDEVKLCSKQAARYRQVMKDVGMKW
jgi:hypothetical protein